MELRHFRYVVALAETLHFGQAAQRLGISQPPLSQQIRQLEDELRVRLFHRTKRQVQLTEAGTAFVAEARLVLAQADHAARIAARVSEGEMGLAVENVVRQPAAVALPRKHPLATRAHVPLRALANEPHVMFSRDLAPRYFDAIVGACAREGFILNVAHEVDNLNRACAIVAAGLGVCFVPASLQQARSRQIVLRPLKPSLPDLDSPLALAYRRAPSSELVQLLVATVKDMVGARRSNGNRHTRQSRNDTQP